MSAHFAPPPPAAVSRILRRFDRDQLAGFIAVAIDLLDVADGDPDDEDDERAGVLMIAPGVDYDPADDDSELDGLPGVPEDAEDDDSDHCSARDDDPGFYIRDIRGWPGDPDDAEDDDPSGDSLDKGEGENDAPGGLLTEKPIYPLDQRLPPINATTAQTAHHGRELGLVPNDRGGWRWPS